MRLLKAILFSVLAIATTHRAFCADMVVPEIASAVRALFPNTKVDQVRPTEMPGVYEAYLGGRVVYVTPPARVILVGHIWSLDTGKDLTAARELVARQAMFKLSELPLHDAIKRVKGNGRRILVVFSDPDCPFCQRLERTLMGVDNVTIYTFEYPIVQLHPNARRDAIAIWCQKNRGKAWEDALLDPEIVGTYKARCKSTPVDRNVALGQRLGVTGTPFLIRADGDSKPGAIPREDLIAWLTPQAPSAAAPNSRTTVERHVARPENK